MKRHFLRLQELKKTLLKDFSPKKILDIGAYKGEWTRNAKKIFLDSSFFLIEANKDLEDFLKLTGENYKISVLGSENNKMINYFKCKNFPHPTGNSIFKEKSKFIFEPEERKTDKLDSIFKNNEIFDLIKIDVQGSELEIIKGGNDTVKKTRFLILELQISEYNEGAPMINEVVSYLKDLNFVLVDILDFIYSEGELIQCDGLFINKNI
mgnify:CR=1 FL=1|tara:strand:+ start:260 stop:886 length:627 start_codon:yes stop_codon:yes gene_type:complete